MITTPSVGEVKAAAWAIRPEQPVDIDQIHDLHRAAFPGPAEAELVDAIRSGPEFIPELSLVAVTEDGSILGHVLVSRIGLVPDDEGGGGIDVLSLAPIAVLPAHQGRGIGTALIEVALQQADQREEPLMIVLGSPALYARHGFVPAAELRIGGPYEEAGEAFAVRPRPGAEPLPSGTAVYPPAFSAA